MVDFFRTWKSPEASARYFKRNPRTVLLIVRKFYLSNDPVNEEQNKVREERQGSLGDQGGVMSPEKPIAPLVRN